MPARRTIEERVAALERRLDASTPTESSPAGPDEERIDRLESRIDDLEADLASLQSELQAVRGYVGNVEHVNETVERRANAAIAAVERLESAPKTPPPIATATPQSRPEAAAEPSQEAATETDDAESADSGLRERLRKFI